MPALTPDMATLAHALNPADAVDHAGAPSFDAVYEAHVGFVWRVVRTFGVPPAQLEDAVQDVFLVVHRRLAEWQGRASITTWLFAIARKIASTHRRRASKRTEALTEALADRIDGDRGRVGDPFAEAARAQAAATVLAILDQLDDDKRMVFALVELEQLPVPEVARMLELNLNTTYSRLRHARQAFEAAVKKQVVR